MVGGDCCEDRNHRQLNVSAGESLRGLLQALRYQPICHLKQRQEYLELLGLYVWMHYRVSRYHAAECRAKMVQAARRSKQQHFILKHPGQFVKNQFQNLPICFLYEKNTPFISLLPLHTGKSTQFTCKPGTFPYFQYLCAYHFEALKKDTEGR